MISINNLKPIPKFIVFKSHAFAILGIQFSVRGEEISALALFINISLYTRILITENNEKSKITLERGVSKWLMGNDYYLVWP